MKHTKRFITPLLITSALLAAGCGSDSETTAGSAANTTPAGAALSASSVAASATSAAATTAAPAAMPAGAKAIKDKGKIVVGVKYDVPLFGLKNPTNNEIEGFDVEIGKLIAGKIFGGDIKGKVEFVEAVSKNREPFIQEGKVDLVISTYTINAARKEVVGFAGPYYVAGQDILVKKSNDAVKAVTDLNGKKVCSVTGSTSLTNVQAKAPQADLSIVFDKYSLCVEALKDGRVEAVTTDNIILLGFVKDDPSNLKLVGNPFTTEPYGIGLKKTDTELRNYINDIVEAAYKDGSWKKAFDATIGASGEKAPNPPPVDRYV